MNVSLTEKQKKYIASQVKTGDFQNSSEVVRDALRLHERYRRLVLDELKAEIEKGWAGKASTRKVKDILEDKRKARAE